MGDGGGSSRPDWYDEAARLYHEDKQTLQEIGDRFGKTRERVRQVLNALGVGTRGRGGAAEVTKERTLANRPKCQVCGAPVHGPNRRFCSAKCHGMAREQPLPEWAAQAFENVRQGMGYYAACKATGMPSDEARKKCFSLYTRMQRKGLAAPKKVRVQCRSCNRWFWLPREQGAAHEVGFHCARCREK